MTDDIDRCVICNHPDKRDLSRTLVHWKDAPLGMAYEHVLRCNDPRACLRRLQAAGKPWPLVS